MLLNITEDWRAQEGLQTGDVALGGVVLQSGDVILAGSTGRSTESSEGIFSGDAGSDFVAYRLDSESGAMIWRWEYSTGDTFADSFFAAASASGTLQVDEAVVLGGSTEGSFDADNPSSSMHLAAVKLNATTGIEIWRFQQAPEDVVDSSSGGVTAQGRGSVVGVAADPAGDYFLVGYVVGALTEEAEIEASGDLDFFAMKLNGTTGEMMWVAQDTISGSDEIFYSAASDSDGNLFASGYAVEYSDSHTAVLGSSRNSVVAKITSDGELLWTRYGDADRDEAFQAVAVDSEGNVYAAGSYSAVQDTNTMVTVIKEGPSLVKLYGPTGDTLWDYVDVATDNDNNISNSSSSGTVFRSVSVDKSFGLVVCGGMTTNGLWAADASTLRNSSSGSGGYGFAVGVVEDDTGVELGRWQGGTEDKDVITFVSVGTEGSVYLGGYTNGSWSGPSNGGEDIAAAKFPPLNRTTLTALTPAHTSASTSSSTTGAAAATEAMFTAPPSAISNGSSTSVITDISGSYSTAGVTPAPTTWENASSSAGGVGQGVADGDRSSVDDWAVPLAVIGTLTAGLLLCIYGAKRRKRQGAACVGAKSSVTLSGLGASPSNTATAVTTARGVAKSTLLSSSPTTSTVGDLESGNAAVDAAASAVASAAAVASVGTTAPASGVAIEDTNFDNSSPPPPSMEALDVSATTTPSSRGNPPSKSSSRGAMRSAAALAGSGAACFGDETGGVDGTTPHLPSTPEEVKQRHTHHLNLEIPARGLSPHTTATPETNDAKYIPVAIDEKDGTTAPATAVLATAASPTLVSGGAGRRRASGAAVDIGRNDSAAGDGEDECFPSAPRSGPSIDWLFRSPKTPADSEVTEQDLSEREVPSKAQAVKGGEGSSRLAEVGVAAAAAAAVASAAAAVVTAAGVFLGNDESQDGISDAESAFNGRKDSENFTGPGMYGIGIASAEAAGAATVKPGEVEKSSGSGNGATGDTFVNDRAVAGVGPGDEARGSDMNGGVVVAHDAGSIIDNDHRHKEIRSRNMEQHATYSRASNSIYITSNHGGRRWDSEPDGGHKHRSAEDDSDADDAFRGNASPYSLSPASSIPALLPMPRSFSGIGSLVTPTELSRSFSAVGFGDMDAGEPPVVSPCGTSPYGILHGNRRIWESSSFAASSPPPPSLLPSIDGTPSRTAATNPPVAPGIPRTDLTSPSALTEDDSRPPLARPPRATSPRHRLSLQRQQQQQQPTGVAMTSVVSGRSSSDHHAIAVGAGDQRSASASGVDVVGVGDRVDGNAVDDTGFIDNLVIGQVRGGGDHGGGGSETAGCELGYKVYDVSDDDDRRTSSSTPVAEPLVGAE